MFVKIHCTRKISLRDVIVLILLQYLHNSNLNRIKIQSIFFQSRDGIQGCTNGDALSKREKHMLRECIVQWTTDQFGRRKPETK